MNGSPVTGLQKFPNPSKPVRTLSPRKGIYGIELIITTNILELYQSMVAINNAGF